ncbi:MAG: TlyA family RNA methyltransferase [Kiritimatiellae bacterium]|nr:TlyA family RNA methyltransferase [Kiritimatiellia bacterium]
MKSRYDVLLTSRGLAESREKAQRLIRAGQVRVNGQVMTKPGVQIDAEAELDVAQPPRFVSRGGDKLMGAFETWPELSPKDHVCIDIGSSTGGFTDCLLQHGARQVYAVDVGKGQLHWDLRNDPRITVMEQTNARYLEPADFDPRPSFGVTDVSFISLRLILPAADRVLIPGSVFVSLIKPQFEAGAENLRKGVVVDPAIRQEVVDRICAFGEHDLGWRCAGVVPSPLTGPKGNVEFLALWKKPSMGSTASTDSARIAT